MLIHKYVSYHLETNIDFFLVLLQTIPNKTIKKKKNSF